MSEAVVLVHGIWMTGIDLIPLRHRLRGQGFAATIFRYPSLLNRPAANAALLADHLRTLDADRIHFVGHSLGGLVLLHLFDHYPVERPGRVVLLGSPVNGSGVARVLARRGITRPILGRSGDRGLLGGSPACPTDREVGTIAGDRAIGIGRVLGGIDGPSDGTVAVSETRVPGDADHVTLPVTHTGLVFSSEVAAHVARFLKTGRFADPDAP